MELTRRQFVQVTGAAAAGVAFSGLGSDLKPVMAHARELKTKAAKELSRLWHGYGRLKIEGVQIAYRIRATSDSHRRARRDRTVAADHRRSDSPNN